MGLAHQAANIAQRLLWVKTETGPVRQTTQGMQQTVEKSALVAVWHLLGATAASAIMPTAPSLFSPMT